MRKVFKKTISILLVAVMVFGAAPLSGFVGLELPEFGGLKKIADSVLDFFDGFVTKADAATSGACGENLAWNFDESIGTLTISGTGKMDDYFSVSDVPWYNKRELIKTVVIKQGVTTIGFSAFDGCTNLTNVAIPDSITSIGSYAFRLCKKLSNIVIPNSVINIGYQAFYYCERLTNITIGNDIRDIGFYAFHYTGFYNDFNNWDEGVLYIENYLIDVDDSISSTYSVKNGTVLISNYAFDTCKKVKNVTIPDTLKYIGTHSFSGCENLIKISLPDDIVSIGSSAFRNTGIYNDYSNWENDVLYIDNHLIEARRSILGEYSIKDNTKCIADCAFTDCVDLLNLKITDKVTNIGDHAFEDCHNLTGITIPKSVTSIGDYAFRSCYKLTDVYFAGSEHEWNTISIGISNDVITNATIHFYQTPENDETSDRVTGIDILKSKTQMTDSAMLMEATVYPETAENKEIIWSSSNPDVAIFQNESIGVLTAIGDGYTVVTATTVDGGYSDSCIVFVGNEIMFVSSNDGNSIAEGEIHEFNVSLIDLESLELTNSGQISIIKPSSESTAGISFVVENSSVAKVDSIENVDGYIKLKIKGVSSGTTYVTMTNSKTYEEKYLPIYVFDGENTFYADSVPKYFDFYGEAKNFNHNGLKIYDYEYTEKSNGSTDVRFNVYSSNTNCGSVEVYDADGNLKSSYMIEPFHGGDPTGIWDNLELMGQTVVVLVNLDLYNDTNPVCSSKTPISTTIPKDGYMKITNDISDSDICLIYNIVTLAIKSIDFQKSEIDLAGDAPKVAEEASKKVINEILSTGGKTIKGILGKIIKKLDIPNATLNTKDVLELIQTLFDNLNIDFGEIFLESIGKVCVEKLADILIERLGVYGKTVKGLFAFNEGLQIYNLGEDCHRSILSGSSYIYGKQSDKDKKVSNGIIYEGDIDTETVFRTYAIAYGDIYVEMSTLYGAEDMELYDISLVKDGNTVQPSEKVQVSIPIPKDWNKNKVKVYRVTLDGIYMQYEDMKGKVDGNYIVFETDHFSYYAIVEEFDGTIDIPTPSTTTINYGDKIILHANIEGELPTGARIVWTPSNNNFEVVEVSADGLSCKITPKSSGTTTFTASVVDADEKVLSTDTQDMTAKAGLWQKIVAFFKKLFGLTKTIPQSKMF